MVRTLKAAAFQKHFIVWEYRRARISLTYFSKKGHVFLESLDTHPAIMKSSSYTFHSSNKEAWFKETLQRLRGKYLASGSSAITHWAGCSNKEYLTQYLID